MTPRETLVTIGLPVFNGGPFVEEALRSILTQDHDELEVLIADNASTDDTRTLLARDFPQVRVLALLSNRGAVARTHGVRALHTPYVAFCDDDSWWAPGALAAAARHFDEHPRLGLLAARTLDFGGVTVNEVPTWRADQMPYGGVRDSGNTREGPPYAAREMTEERLVIIHSPSLP